jgi:hypothetical protein
MYQHYNTPKHGIKGGFKPHKGLTNAGSNRQTTRVCKTRLAFAN